MTAEPRRIPLLGCIADDVTGATDLALNLVQGGLCVVQVFGTPTVRELSEINADAVVVALKTRSIPKDEAIALSLSALNALRESGMQRFFFKYCSTFDSTEQGNIGPVALALLQDLDAAQTIFCPAFPRNGRTVYQGHLFVNGKLLHESGMENHPLNPMTDANLVRFLAKQAGRDVGLLSYDQLRKANGRLKHLANEGISLVMVDACAEAHLRMLAETAGQMSLVTGGSGIARYLPDVYRSEGLVTSGPYAPPLPDLTGRALILSGSCSKATNRQVAWMRSRCPSKEIDVPAILADSEAALAGVIRWAKNADERQPLLIYSTSSPERVSALQREHGGFEVAQAIENFLANVAFMLVPELNVDKLIVAGGETSGAVVEKLGVKSIRIGPEICAGVPWTESLSPPRIALALKSGNFGEEDFFASAMEMMS